MPEMGRIIKVRVSDAEPVPLVDLVEFWLDGHLQEAVTKSEGDAGNCSASCYLVVEDPKQPSTWHLRVKDSDGTPNHTLMGGAWAALHSGYRGNKYEGADKEKALAKLKALYASENMPLPIEEMAEESKPSEEKVIEVEEPKVEELMAESDEGAVLMIGEGALNGYPGPVVMDVALIEPGFGNSKDNHYYSKEMLRNAAPKFKGVKMFLTNHITDEHNSRNEVSEILDCPVRFTTTGAPVARVGVSHPVFAQDIRNREQLGTLKDLQCSILGTGKVKRDAVEEGGRKGHLVEDIVDIKSVDWVPHAGAGGRVLNLVEMEGDKMGETEKKEEGVEEKKKEETVIEAIHEQAKALDSSVVLPLLMEADLPRKTMGRLAARQYFKVEEVQAAIAEMREVIAEVADGGRPRNLGASGKAPEPEQKPEDVAEAERAILRRHGLLMK